MQPTKVFQVEWSGNSLIIIPQGPTLNFHYQDVHHEANSLYRMADDPKTQNIVVDLHVVDYLDSIIIGAMIRLFQKPRNRGGKSVFCCGSPELLDVLKCIRVGSMWPHYDTREEALEAVNVEESRA